MKKILVIGYGVSGRAAAAFLRKQGHNVIVVDKKGGPGILLDTPDLPLHDISQIIVSPGIPPSHPLLTKAKALGIEVIGEIELAFRHIKNPCFAITGSNGKTTTVLLTTHILNNAGKKARALGNVGESLTGYLLDADPNEILVIELSSFQLETVEARCLDAALVLNITPNHLDRHPSMQAYAEAKARIQHCLKPTGKLYISHQVHRDFPSLFSDAEIFEKDVDLINGLSYMQLGMPSKQSVQAAYLICTRCGVTNAEFLRELETFRKPAHRIEWVAEIDGVSYYNDSKSSNVHSVMHAVGRFVGPVVLIVGGVHKGSSYRPWIESFHGKVKALIAYGEAAPIMEQELGEIFPFYKVEKFAEAVQRARIEAKAKETVLLSPGCSSYDQFQSYEHRGEEFKRLVKQGNV
jgi:UDP-N-acetylmuramoylalanine--D-glutamate ligase